VNWCSPLQARRDREKTRGRDGDRRASELTETPYGQEKEKDKEIDKEKKQGG
jgi:hypothetical protein